MSKPEFFVTPGYGDYMREHLHYSQAVKIGNRVETSGQGGWDDEFQIPNDLGEEYATHRQQQVFFPRDTPSWFKLFIHECAEAQHS